MNKEFNHREHRGHREKERGDSKKKNKPQRAQRDFLIVKKE
jgi:hypothetical protein